MGWIIGVVAVLFVVGMGMSLVPTPQDKALGRLRELAREMGFQMRLVACPAWLIGPGGEKGKGMVAQYVWPETTPFRADPVRALVIGTEVNVTEGKAPMLHETQAPRWMLGMGFSESSSTAYVSEPVVLQNKGGDAAMRDFLTEVKETLHTCRSKI